MVDEEILINEEGIRLDENYHEKRQDESRGTIHKDLEGGDSNKFKLVFIFSIFFLAISLVAVASILAWAYVEREHSISDKAQLHEPTRLYTSISATNLYNSTKQKPHKKKPGYIPEEPRSSIPEEETEKMHLFRVYDAISTGAVCLDGTPPAYYLRPGKGLGQNRWIVHFNGGAWCFDEKACLERSRGSLGSTKHLPPAPPVIQGINSANGQINPDFYDWNLVWIVYCDGASFTGDRALPVIVEGESIFFRGKRVLNAVVTDLITRGILNAEGIILTGSSAGSMTAMFAVDSFAEQIPSVPMHVLSDAGFFIETQQMGGKNVGAMFKKIYDMHNSSVGLNQDCIRKFGLVMGWKCFLPQHTFKFIKHPVFVLNAAYDVWAMIYFVGINCKFPAVTMPLARRKRSSLENGTELQVESGPKVSRLESWPKFSQIESRPKFSEIETRPKDSPLNQTLLYAKKPRDISGFEMMPFFRTETQQNDEIGKAASKESTFNEASVKKSEISVSPSNTTDRNETKRNFQSGMGGDSILDSLDKAFPVPLQTPEIKNEASNSLHLNIDQGNDVGHEAVNGFRKPMDAGNALDIPSQPAINGPDNIPSNAKQDGLSLNPLSRSVETLTNVANKAQKNDMDKETIGLLNEVFTKLQSLMPNKKANATMLKMLNGTAAAKPQKQNPLKIDTLHPHKIGPQNLNKLNSSKIVNPQKKLNEGIKHPNIQGKNISELLKQAKNTKQFMKVFGQRPIHLSDFFQKTQNANAGKNRGKVVKAVKKKRSAGIVKEYINILRSDPPECTANQMIRVMQYRTAMLQATATVAATPSAGLFLISCIQHSMSLFDETWTGVIVKQKSIQQAFGDWYYGRGTNHYNIDGVYPTNPSCP